MNLWAFTPAMFDACARVAPSARGERELVDAVRLAQHEFGTVFQVLPCREPVLDLSTQADVARVTSAVRGLTVRL
jgi:glucose-1-phosphate thymidylyltransferase